MNRCKEVQVKENAKTFVAELCGTSQWHIWHPARAAPSSRNTETNTKTKIKTNTRKYLKKSWKFVWNKSVTYMARATRAAGSQQIITSNIWCINCTAPTWFIAQIVKKYSKCTLCNILDTLCKICTNCTKFAQIVQNVHILKSVEHHIGPKLKWQTQDIYICSEEAVILKKWVLTDIWRLTNLEEMLFDRHLKSCFWQIWMRCFLTNMTAMLCSLSVFSVSISTCQEWKLLQFFWPLETSEEEDDNWSTFWRVGTFNFVTRQMLFGFPPSSSFPFLWWTLRLCTMHCNPLVRNPNLGQDP